MTKTEEIIKAAYKPVEYKLSKIKPNNIVIGDVFYAIHGEKSRPCVVINIDKGFATYIPLSSTYTYMCYYRCKGRFFKNKWFTKTISVTAEKNVKDNFICVFDCPRNLHKAVKLLKQEFDIGKNKKKY